MSSLDRKIYSLFKKGVYDGQLDITGRLSAMGVPISGGGIPLMIGATGYEPHTYYVDVKGGKDTYSGLKSNEPLAKIATAITKARARVDWNVSPWARRDIIVVAPGTYAENITALASGTILMGLGWDNRDAQMGVKIKPASGVPVSVGGIVNSAFLGIGFQTTGVEKCFKGGVVNNCLFLGCRFEGDAESSTAAKLFESCDMTRTKILDCEFSCGDIGIDILGVGGSPYSKIAHNLIKDCRFDQIDTAGIQTAAGTVGASNFVIGVRMIGGGVTLALGINDLAGKLDCQDCNIIVGSGGNGYINCRSVSGCYENGVLVTS